MLAIRMQRTGRSGHAQFRVIVQDSRFSPKRGRVVSYLGNYDPHTKTAQLNTDKALEYLNNGAQPSDRVARLFKKEGIKLPTWVKLDEPRQRAVRNPEKRRSTAPAQPAESPAETPTSAEPSAEAETKDETATPEQPATETQESPAEEESKPEADETTTAETADDNPEVDAKA